MSELPFSSLHWHATWAVIAFCWICAGIPSRPSMDVVLAEESTIAFAVISKPPVDRAHIAARVSIEGIVEDLTLLATEQILGNPIWKTLEVCHAVKLEGHKVPNGFRVDWVRVLDSAMLPMALQGFAGDCLLNKALEIAPFAD